MSSLVHRGVLYLDDSDHIHIRIIALVHMGVLFLDDSGHIHIMTVATFISVYNLYYKIRFCDKYWFLSGFN